MGRKKKGFNWKAREKSETVVDRSEEKKIQLDLGAESAEKGYDDCNVLALPSGKRKSKKKVENIKKVKKLSKKERKKLQTIVGQKEKKAKRASLLESLSAVQASPDELNLLTSVTEIQSGRLKRKLVQEAEKGVRVNTVSGSGKKGRMTVPTSRDEDEESVHTSDMSSDEEDSEGQDSAEGSEDEGVGSEETGGNSDSGGSEEGDTLTEKSSEQKPSERETNAGSDIRTSSSKDSQNISTTDSDGVLKDKALKTGTSVTGKPVVHIPVTRQSDIQEARLKLPILAEEQGVMEAINDNPVTIICGETGSGKTTQVPQFLYEAGYAHGSGIIGITEPRRVAAVAMSKRVATEMSLPTSEVSYQIRYEGNVSSKTKIKFMTDGVLLKEVQQDFLLTKYSVIVIDEAHERSMYTDIMIGLLSRIVPLRHKKGSPLKLVIMSATLRVEDFTENPRLFKTKPPVIKVDARQFPVTVHFNKRTPLDNYLNEAYRKACKIHRMLPEGGILVFVTGQQEVHTLCRKLKQTFPLLDKHGNKVPHQEKQKKKRDPSKANAAPELPKVNLDNYSVAPLDEEAEREGTVLDIPLNSGDTAEGDDLDELDVGAEELLEAAGDCTEPLYVLPLYSLLPSHKQAKVFEEVPDGYRLCVVATNVAETSLTIPNVKYVVDTGKMKTKFYDKVTGVSTFKITWTSKAGANQRAGRAGRVGPGHCYRLYSSAVFNDEFELFSAAEITRRPVEDLVLQMKDMSIEKVVNFPYPTPPDSSQIKAAESLLVSLGALSKPPGKFKSFKETKKEQVTTITPLGRGMACFPVSPRYAKMLALGHQHKLLPYVVAMVAALSVEEIFVETYMTGKDEDETDQAKQKYVQMVNIKRRWAGQGHSLLLGDLMVMLKAVGSSEFEGCSPSFCEAHGIRLKAIRECRKLRWQLTNSVNAVMRDADICVDPKMEPPTDAQAKMLRQIVLSGMGDHIARRYPELPATDPNFKKLRYAYQCQDLEDPVFIHPTSVLYKERPEFVIYQYIHETSKLYMKGIVGVQPEWLPLFASAHVTLSSPLNDPPPAYSGVKDQVVCHMTSRYGLRGWPLPAVELEYPEGMDKYKLFAQFLLKGQVVEKLKKYTPDLLSLPSTMVKSWAKLQPRTEALLSALVKERVSSRSALLKVWKRDRNYLLQAYQQWLPEALHAELQLLWPPVT